MIIFKGGRSNGKLHYLMEHMPKRKVNTGDCIAVHESMYTVMARDERYIICVNKEDDEYFIIDLVRQERGPDNMIFCIGYENKKQCEERLKELQEGQIELSGRYSIPLDIPGIK